jgi:EAL domain-containing protein (putative c-di-GMP-specific phosphodiesterase class I)
LFIAEGVETEGERQALQQLGITLAQGFLLGRPQRFASFAAMKQHYNN